MISWPTLIGVIAAAKRRGGPSVLGFAKQPSVISDPVTVPTHNAGDTLILFEMSATSSPPATRSGYTSIITSLGAAASGYVQWRISYIVDVAGTITSIASSSNRIWVIAARNAAIGATQLTESGVVSSGGLATYSAAALTLTSAGACQVISGVLLNQFATAYGTPSGLTMLGDSLSPALGGAGWAVCKSAENVSSYPSVVWPITYGGGAVISNWAIELK